MHLKLSNLSVSPVSGQHTGWYNIYAYWGLGGFFICQLPAPVLFLIFCLFLFLTDRNESFIYTECYFSLD